jgi:FlaA1/EpsC-like NDP-sugar epimerase
MGEPVKIVDLAKRMIQLSGKKVDLIFTGLRKGEKLYEELLIQEEETIDTPHPKLKIAKNEQVRDIPLGWFDDLIHANGSWDITLLSRLVPEYTVTSHI